ncbi:hypothetical protein A3K69_02000 [Candidatus Bathyarchaeota archaeon RBG_16_57_9]|nr:MAG: hypothetical protein A3K69_02000 [Candidatus Bathyarchaeota archaeon RBG_16_57_9]
MVLGAVLRTRPVPPMTLALPGQHLSRGDALEEGRFQAPLVGVGLDAVDGAYVGRRRLRHLVTVAVRPAYPLLQDA